MGNNFRIYQDNYADFTVVSNRFIDEYMEDANDAQLKIYLYLMRMLGADLATGVSDIADRFNYTEKDVLRALKYWEKKGILKLDYDSAKTLVGVHMLSLGQPSEAQTLPAPSPEACAPKPKTITMETVTGEVADIHTYVKPQYTRDDLIEFKSSGSSAQLVFVAESYLNRPLSQSDLTTLVFISKTLCFSDDLTDYLLQYCVGRGKTSNRYIEKVAIDWAESGISTPEQAASHVAKFDRVYDIMRALGKNNTEPTPVELDLISKWIKVYAFSMEVILEACRRTVLNTDRARFKYADSILTRWFELGIRTVAEIDKKDIPKKRPSSGQSAAGQTASSGAASKNKFNQFAQNSYDFDALEKELINN